MGTSFTSTEATLEREYEGRFNLCRNWRQLFILVNMDGKGLTVFLLLLFMMSAATACKVADVFCFENCTTTSVSQFCACVVQEVVGRNDSQSLGNGELISEFEGQAEMILANGNGCTYHCSFIIIPQNLLQGTVFIVQFHCTEVCGTTITKYQSPTGFLVPFLPPPGCPAELDFENPCDCTTTTDPTTTDPTSRNSRTASIAEHTALPVISCNSEAESSSASGTTAMFFINAILTGTSVVMLLVF